MSVDLVVWHTRARLSDMEALELYHALCEGDASGVAAHAGVDKFYRDITSLYPEHDDVPTDQRGDLEPCPWTEIHRSAGHVHMVYASSVANKVDPLIWELAHQQGLAVFDPQTGYVSYPKPGGGFTRPRPGTKAFPKAMIAVSIAAILLVVGARGICWISTDIGLILDSSSWRYARAAVESSYVTAHGNPHITYLFIAGSSQFKGDRVEIPTRSTSRRHARLLVGDYPPGASLEILYDPDDPSRNVINRPEPNELLGLSLLGLVALAFFVAGCWLLWWAIGGHHRCFPSVGSPNTLPHGPSGPPSVSGR